jgi:hypothetical protein
MSGPMSDWLADAAQTLGTILTRASCTVLSRPDSCWGSWYGMAPHAFDNVLLRPVGKVMTPPG